MTIQELIEYAVLDTLGLLDEQERREFELAFAACAPAVQAMIRREQTRLSDIDRWLPNVQAPVHLRAQVIEAVRRAVEAEEAGLVEQAAPWTPPEMVASRRVSHLWRATALASVAAALVLGGTTLWLNVAIRDINTVLDDNRLSDQTLLSLGPKFNEYFYNEATRLVAFQAHEGFEGKATLMLDPAAGKAYLVCHNLPTTSSGRPYTLVIVGDDGAPAQSLAQFSSDGRLMGREVLQVTIKPGDRFAILAAGEDGQAQPVLTARSVPQS